MTFKQGDRRGVPRDRFASSRSSPFEASSRAATVGRHPSQVPSGATVISSSPPSVIAVGSRPLALPPSRVAIGAPAIGPSRPFPVELGSETGACSPSQVPVGTRPATSAAPPVVHEHPSYPPLAVLRLRMHSADPMPPEEAQLEREADDLADQVVTAAPSHRDPKRRIGAEQAPDSTGHPLDRDIRAFMEPRLGHSFGQVRVHTDAGAAESARAMSARAFTVGQDIYFSAGHYRPGTSAGQKIIAHELVHTLQQASGRNPGGITQRSPDETGAAKGAGKITNSTYEEELQVIRYALGAQELGRLAEGTVLYSALGWQAVGMADGAFFAGPFTSDMGTFYYVYRFSGSDPNTNTHTLSRGAFLPGSDTKDLKASLAQVKGAGVVTATTTALTPPTGAVAIKPSGPPGGTGGRQPPGSGGGSANKPEIAEEPEELTPHRKLWIKAGRGSMKDEINKKFSSIQKVKKSRIDTWEKNAKIKDPKPARDALEVAVEIVGYGMGGVVGGLLGKVMAHGLALEFAKEAGLKSTAKLAEAIFAHAVEPTEEFMEEATKKALKEHKKGNAEVALATKSSLLDCYVEAETLQSISEEDAEGTVFNSTADTRFPSDIALADEVAVMDRLYKGLMEEPESFLRELSVGFIRLLDEIYLEERAEKYGGSVERLLREDPSIHETDRRSGNLLLVAWPYLGKWPDPGLEYVYFNGLASKVNEATLQELKNTPIKDLPLTLSFRFFVRNPYSGWFVDDFVKVWFERRPDDIITVDFDQDEDGLEWLASYATGRSEEFSKEERRKYAPLGARKLYEQIKNKPIRNLHNSDIF